MKAINKQLFLQLVDWIADSGHTPYIEAVGSSVTGLPDEHFTSDTVRMNISAQAVSYFNVSDEGVSFGTRFNRIHHDVYVPFSAMVGVVSFEAKRKLTVRQGWIINRPEITGHTVQQKKEPESKPKGGLRLVD